MHITTRRSYLDKYNESIFYSKRHTLLTVAPARWVNTTSPPSLTLLSELKTSKLKNTENPEKCFIWSFSFTPPCKACNKAHSGHTQPVHLLFELPPLQTVLICASLSALSLYTTMYYFFAGSV